MILEAIKGLGDDKNGSNKSAISKYIQSKYGELPPAPLLTAHLARMKEARELIFLKNNYFRAGAPGAPPWRGRGRPPKAMDPVEAAVKQPTAGMPKARGHPPKKAKTEDGASPAPAPAPAPAGDGPAPVKRGRARPPKVRPVVPSEMAAV